LKGVFNCRNPKPKYAFAWDVNKVLAYLQTLTGELSDKMLTVKVVMLLALASVSRGHELQHLDIRYMSRSNGTVKFDFSKLTKSWRNGKAPLSNSFKSFIHNTVLCPVLSLDAYLARSHPWRENKFQLFLGVQNPHSEVKTCTIARWIKFVLKESGIDTGVYQAHSSRGQ